MFKHKKGVQIERPSYLYLLENKKNEEVRIVLERPQYRIDC
jgi:hypothetical protein